MKVIDHGALTGYISINRGWAGYDADEYYRVGSIAMGLTEGEMETDLENEHLPDGGRRLNGMTDDNGVQRIARTLSRAEQEIKAKLEGKEAEEETREETPKIKKGFQVVSGGMFRHPFEPTVTIKPNCISFSTTCISRLDTVCEGENVRIPFVEVLLNPVERMLAVRPCGKNHPNAFCWTNPEGKGRYIPAKAFCTLLYQILGWDPDYGYSVPAVLRTKDGESILFFDLDNYIGKELHRRRAEAEPASREKERRTESEDTRGIFYGAEDEEPQALDDTREMERKLREYAEYEKRNFGMPAFEHNSDFRVTAIDEDGEWDVMAEAVALGGDHRVDESEIAALLETITENGKGGTR